MDQLAQICESLSTFGFEEAELRTCIQEISPDEQFIRFSRVKEASGLRTIYEGLDTQRGCEIAWHSISVQDFTHQEVLNLRSRVQALEVLAHDNLLTLHATWVDLSGKTLVLITETQSSLVTHLNRIGKPWLKIIKLWAKGLLEGLKYLHEQSIQLNSLSMHDLFIDCHAGTIKIGEFGLHCGIQSSGLPVNIEYVAPEALKGESSAAADVYSFGVCLAQIVTLKQPYQECKSMLSTMKKISEHRPPACVFLIEDEEVRSFILLCLKPCSSRPTVSELLRHPFLQLDKSPHLTRPVELKEIDALESVSTTELLPGKCIEVSLVLAVNGARQGIKFEFDLQKDSIEEVTKDLIRELHVNPEYYEILANTICQKITSEVSHTIALGKSTESRDEFSDSPDSECDSPDGIVPITLPPTMKPGGYFQQI